ncbi:hypothetical protein BDZ89DRAFT_965704, partial [Hymenopellis radicata]
VKVSFVLLPWHDELPELINTTQSKLTANRFLRVRKLILHVQEKLDKVPTSSSRTTSRASSERSSFDGNHHVHGHPLPTHSHSAKLAEASYEILCNDVLLPLDISLGAVRQYVWRQGSELVMHYRRKAQ